MKRLLKIVLVIVLLLLGGAAGAFFYFKNKFFQADPNYLVVRDLGEPFEFRWVAQDVGNRVEPHSAMLVPVRLPGVDHPLYMQFDLGAPSSKLYEKTIRSIDRQFGLVDGGIADDATRLSDFSFEVGTATVHASQIELRAAGRDVDWDDPPTILNIGTIGSDLLDQRTVVIDYAAARITLLDDVPADVAPTDAYADFEFAGRRVLLHAELNGKPSEVMFDTGSSAFELMMDEDTFTELAVPGAVEESYVANSWGRGVVVHNIAAEGHLRFGATDVPLTFVTYAEWPNKLQQFLLSFSNMGGLMGNKLFLDKTLVLDGKRLRYAVVDSPAASATPDDADLAAEEAPEAAAGIASDRPQSS